VPYVEGVPAFFASMHNAGEVAILTRVLGIDVRWSVRARLTQRLADYFHGIGILSIAVPLKIIGAAWVLVKEACKTFKTWHP
jgi:ABC-type Fe3+ transport system permease subunit